MSLVDWIIGGWAVLASLAWVAAYSGALLRLRHAIELMRWSRPDTPEPDEWPTISVIIPACDEVATLEPALGSLLDQDYPALELIVIDDRSTDGTGELVDRLAAKDTRIRPLHITLLPDGWLGKMHALHVGTRQASGDWLLFTDADVHFAPGALRKAAATVVADELDHLALVPDMKPSGLLHSVFLNSFLLGLLFALRSHKVEDPRSDAYFGVPSCRCSCCPLDSGS